MFEATKQQLLVKTEEKIHQIQAEKEGLSALLVKQVELEKQAEWKKGLLEKLEKQIIRKWVTKKKRGQLKVQLQVTMDEIAKLSNERREQTYAYQEQLFVYQNQLQTYKEARTYAEMDMDRFSVENFFQTNDITLMKSDKGSNHNPQSDYTSLSDCILVHKTNYPPISGNISTTKENRLVLGNFHLALPTLQIEAKVPVYSHRDTVHFAVNGEVGSHALGNWDNRKYAILIPFADAPLGQLRQAAPMDTYFKGRISLPSTAILLCPALEKEKYQNLGIRIIGYEGENVTGYVSEVIKMMGYCHEVNGAWGWENQEHNETYIKLIQSLGFAHTPHFLTEESAYDNKQTILEFLNTVISIIQEKIKGYSQHDYMMDKQSLISEFKKMENNWPLLLQSLKQTTTDYGLRQDLLTQGIDLSGYHPVNSNDDNRNMYENFLDQILISAKYRENIKER